MNPFLQQLHRLRRIALASRCLTTLLVVGALALLLLLLLGLADGLAGLEASARQSLLIALALITVVTLVVLLRRATRLPLAKVADQADTLLADPRRPFSAALSLPPSTENSLTQLLTSRAIEQATTHLKTLPTRHFIPWRSLGRAIAALLLIVGTLAALRSTLPDAFTTITSRLRHPSADIAPYSPLRFIVSPENPSVTYGGELSLNCEIQGNTLKHPVECLIRHTHSGKILRLPAYRESATTFSRQLTNITEPVSIAFACGKARSAWQPLDLRLVPNILGGTVTITPPAYTGLTPTSFPLESNQIEAISGSKIRLELTSNRPLGSGSLELSPVAGLQTLPLQVNAEIDAQTARFDWTAGNSGDITALVTDLRGTPTTDPLRISFRALPDQIPSVNLLSPPAMLLATPTTRIPIEGSASDDFSLAKFQFIRTLSGLRDRAITVAASLQEKTFDFHETLDLEELGLLPGQTIELLLEAHDHNPTMLGQGSSQISRIHIISDEQYAQIIRARTTIQQLNSKFEAAAQAMENARESLQKLREAVEKNQPEEIAKAAAKAAADHQKSLDTLNRIKEDFPAFELEKELADLADKQAEDLEENLETLKDLKPQAPAEELNEKIDDMLGNLQKRKQQQEQLEQNFDDVKEHGKFLKLAVAFRQIHADQASLLKRLIAIVKELQQGIDINRRSLPLLAETQEKNREKLLKLATDLEATVEAAPKDIESLLPMIDSATQFLEALKTAAPEGLMANAAQHAKSGRASEATHQAQLAYDQLDRLLNLEGPFPEAARGQSPKFDIPNPDAKKTLEQLLQALLQQQQQQQQQNQNGPGQPGQGQEGGMGGEGNGFPMNNIPLLGPERLQFQSDSLAQGRGKGEADANTPPPPLPTEASLSRLKPEEHRTGANSATNTESIPDAYREAVKRFLSTP